LFKTKKHISNQNTIITTKLSKKTKSRINIKFKEIKGNIPQRVNIPMNRENSRGTNAVSLIGVEGFISS